MNKIIIILSLILSFSLMGKGFKVDTDRLSMIYCSSLFACNYFYATLNYASTMECINRIKPIFKDATKGTINIERSKKIVACFEMFSDVCGNGEKYNARSLFLIKCFDKKTNVLHLLK